MTEEEWLSCTDPDTLVAYLEATASKRSLRLLCCACSRRLWHLLETEALRQAVDAFERYADGEIAEDSFRSIIRTTHPVRNYQAEMFSDPCRDCILCAAYALNLAMRVIPEYGFRRPMEFYALATKPNSDDERAAHIDLIREIFGNPFRRSEIPPNCLSWGEGIIGKLATAIYEERTLPSGVLDGERLGILADALEESGCRDVDLLAHLRSPGPHVRGCWALDLVLMRSDSRGGD